ncbi:hypothetical protein [Halostreptopolyspora alba]|uniref:Uncharacterized protein n=1 Tax=Halostreptopolyspora alba TaxID=2487137 RepID=A0A3N0E5V5_9ACTN|nr:hypothetical protein EFW17_17100 [Nocardiopsaceae bacterium YIM 96095]
MAPPIRAVPMRWHGAYFDPFKEVNPAGYHDRPCWHDATSREAGTKREDSITQGVKYRLSQRARSRAGTRGDSELRMRKDNNRAIDASDGEPVACAAHGDR